MQWSEQFSSAGPVIRWGARARRRWDNLCRPVAVPSTTISHPNWGEMPGRLPGALRGTFPQDALTEKVGN